MALFTLLQTSLMSRSSLALLCCRLPSSIAMIHVRWPEKPQEEESGKSRKSLNIVKKVALTL